MSDALTHDMAPDAAPDPYYERPSIGERWATPPSHVLIVDDRKVDRTIFAAYCDLFGHSWAWARDGEEALEEVVRGGVDLVLMNVHVPGGLQAVRDIRRQLGPVAAVPIIAVMDRANPDVIERCLAAGLSAVVAKPVTPARLFSALGAALTSDVSEARSWAPAAIC